MATPSAMEELEALERARSRLEAELSSDENWRALRLSQTVDDVGADSEARRARNTRLEMALADNAHYQAWKQLNGAIDALRARSPGQAQAVDAVVRRATGGKTTYESDLPEDIAAMLRGELPLDAARGEQHGAPIPVADDPSASGHSGLVGRLERLDEPLEAQAKIATTPGRAEASPRPQGRARTLGRQAPPVPADPPEATVTFVVRESRAPLLPSTELPSDLGTERNSALFERLRTLDEKPEPMGQTQSPAEAADEEAEVTIVSVEGLRQSREADERAGIVRRFRKALSGD